MCSLADWEWEQLGERADEQRRYLTLAIAVRTGLRLRADVRGGLGAPLLSRAITHRQPAEVLPHRVAPDQTRKEAIAESSSRQSGTSRSTGLELDSFASSQLVGGTGDTMWARSLRMADFGRRMDMLSMVEEAASRRIVFVSIRRYGTLCLRPLVRVALLVMVDVLQFGEVYGQGPIVRCESAIVRRMLDKMETLQTASAAGGSGCAVNSTVYVVSLAGV